eukprot:scaffold81605_cov28-Tisochrysis_lutea.AAC.7
MGRPAASRRVEPSPRIQAGQPSADRRRTWRWDHIALSRRPQSRLMCVGGACCGASAPFWRLTSPGAPPADGAQKHSLHVYPQSRPAGVGQFGLHAATG